MIPARYTRNSVRPVLSRLEIIEPVSKVSPNNIHITMMIMDIIIPEIPPTTIPSLVGNDQDGEFFSTLRYQYAGAKRSQILHVKKNI
tara:strand:+ start:281 stop:541 length:261 start_codon:yes stop_codon:yes gene_type:complete